MNIIKTINEACKGMKQLISESDEYIDKIYKAPCIYSRNLLLFRLRTTIMELDNACSTINEAIGDNPELRQRDFTLEELSSYTGKNGNAAYVAVNGIVYDVTNNAAWAAGTHFGLTAGKDLSGSFASCHVGQSILNKLIVVGKLM